MAEYGAHDGTRIDGIIRQQRERARVAKRRADRVYYALLAVVVLGIVFYLALPFLRDFWDGRRLALNDSIAANEQTLANLDGEAVDLVAPLADRLTHSVDLVKGMSQLPEFVEIGGVSEEISGIALLWGDEATLLRYEASSRQVERVVLPDDLPEDVIFEGVSEEIAGRWLIWADEPKLLLHEPVKNLTELVTLPDDLPKDAWFDGVSEEIAGGGLIWNSDRLLLRYDPAQGRAETVFFPDDLSDKAILEGVSLEIAGQLLVWGNRSTLLIYDQAQRRADWVMLPDDVPSDLSFNVVPEVIAGGWLIWATNKPSTLLRYEPGERITKKVPLPKDLPGDVWFRGVSGEIAGQWLIWEDGSTLLRYDPVVGRADKVVLPEGLPGDLSFDGVSEEIAGGWLIWGSDATLLHYDPALGRAERVELPDDLSEYARFNGVSEVVAGGALIYGDESTLLRYDPALGRAARVPLPEDLPGDVWFKGVSEVVAGGVLIYGDESTLLRYDPAQGRAEGVTLPDDLPDTLDFQVVSGDIAGGLLIIGYSQTGPGSVENVLLRYDPARGVAARIRDWDPLGKASAETEARKEYVAPEAVMAENVDALEAVFGNGNLAIDPTVEALRDIAGRRQAVSDIIAKAQEDLESFWYGLLQLDKQEQEFADFMAVCRGADPDDDEIRVPAGGLDSGGVTTACVTAWQAQVTAEAGSWWKTLAVQVPPSILLLFLLATLGGLYRYNLRLAGFHSSRADALELLDEAGGFDAETLARVSDALAADRVEMGKASTPTDQAVEIAKAAISRK